MQTQERKQVIGAINALGRRVTAADVAAKTGLPLNVANLELNKVAAEAEGHMEVSTAGDIAYRFDLGFEKAYLASGIARVIEDISQKVFGVAYFLLRISFGVMLIISFIAVILLVIIAVLALSRLGSDSSDGGGGDGGGFSFDFFDYMIFRDIIWWGSSSSYPGQYQSYDRPSIRQPQQDKGNFFYNVFSFLFGDGNPNNHLEERKWQMVAEMIRANRGVVTAEQLAPYTGEDPKNEDAVLPVLVRFDGKPEVSESGNILYVFPSMQVRAAMSPFRQGLVPKFMNEFSWKFTNVPMESLVPVFLLAGCTFSGSWWLYFESSTKLFFVLHHFIPLIVALAAYGTLFLAVPFLRFLILQFINKGIDARNAKRSEYAAALQTRTPELEKKLSEAAQYRIGERTINASNLAYTTDKDILEQEFDHELVQQFEPPKPHANSNSGEFNANPYVSQEHRLRAQSQRSADHGNEQSEAASSQDYNGQQVLPENVIDLRVKKKTERE